MKKAIFISLLLAAFLTSCRRPAVFREYREIGNMTWNRFDILEFDVPVNAGDVLDFDIFLRHHTDFPYDKLFVNITFNAPGGEMRSGDYEFELKDDKGNWRADGMGELWDIELPVRKEMHFEETGICRVRIENKYPKFDTPGIVEVGLIAKKTKE